MIKVSIKNSDNDLIKTMSKFLMHQFIQEHHNHKCLYVGNVQNSGNKNTIYNQDLTHKCTLQKPAKMRFCAFKYTKTIKESEKTK